MTRRPPSSAPPRVGGLQATRVHTLFAQALQLHQRGQPAAAAQLYAQVLGADPAHFDALHLSGVAAAQSGDAQRAVGFFERALRVNPTHPAAHNNLGNALLDLGRLDAALASYDRALALQPDHAQALYNRGNVLKRLDRPREALASYDRAIALQPAYAEAHANRGIVHQALGQHDAALADYDRAIALQPQRAEAFHNRGRLLAAQRRFDDALHDFDRALALNPAYADAYVSAGAALFERGRFADALTCLDRALALAPRDADAHHHRALALGELRRFDEALRAHGEASRLRPDHGPTLASWRSARMLACDWAGLDADVVALERIVDTDGQDVPTPFSLLSLADRPDLHQRAARAWTAANAPAQVVTAPPAPRAAGARIHVAYCSADFHDHATMFLMARLFEVHDRSRFEWSAISFGPHSDGAMRRRLAAAVDRVVDVRERSDHDVAALCRDLGVDIAVDLKGLTGGARPGIFAARAAPLQVSYLGYPGTAGAPYIDYLVADATVVPPDSRAWYDEKVVQLPHSYQVNDPTRPIADDTPSRDAAGLPPAGFVFCCFNNNYKITPPVFDVWMRVLQRVDGSVLWLLQDNALAAENLRREAAARGVDPQRLVFAPRAPLPEHLARHRLADLFLDTAPYNAHTTASDALWAGLPLLTCMGRSFASRVGASLLRAVGLPELVTETWPDYEALAVALATERRTELGALRARLAANRLTAPLFDAERFARHLEAAYMAMVERHRAGLPPQHLVVSDDASVTWDA